MNPQRGELWQLATEGQPVVLVLDSPFTAAWETMVTAAPVAMGVTRDQASNLDVLLPEQNGVGVIMAWATVPLRVVYLAQRVGYVGDRDVLTTIAEVQLAGIRAVVGELPRNIDEWVGAIPADGQALPWHEQVLALMDPVWAGTAPLRHVVTSFGPTGVGHGGPRTRPRTAPPVWAMLHRPRPAH